MTTPTDPKDGVQGAGSSNPWVEFDRLVELARPELGLSDGDLKMLADRGHVDAIATLKTLMAAHGVAIPTPTVEPAPLPAPPTQTKRKTARNRPGRVNAPTTYSLTEGFYRMPNAVADNLLAAMPGPVLKAYVYAHRLADVDGTFHISYGTVAQKIGCKDQRHGRRVFSRLREAGLLRLLERGSATGARANVYQLVPLKVLDLDHVRATLSQRLNTHDKREGSHGTK